MVVSSVVDGGDRRRGVRHDREHGPDVDGAVGDQPLVDRRRRLLRGVDRRQGLLLRRRVAGHDRAGGFVGRHQLVPVVLDGERGEVADLSVEIEQRLDVVGVDQHRVGERVLVRGDLAAEAFRVAARLVGATSRNCNHDERDSERASIGLIAGVGGPRLALSHGRIANRCRRSIGPSPWIAARLSHPLATVREVGSAQVRRRGRGALSSLCRCPARFAVRLTEVAMFASIASAMVFGAEGYPIQVEVQVSKGLPGFRMVGRPDETTREARDRARAALQSSGIDWPAANITVNLAPSSDRKSGSGLDLALAIGVLVAIEMIPREAVDGLAFVAELGLDGSLRPVAGHRADGRRARRTRCRRARRLRRRGPGGRAGACAADLEPHRVARRPGERRRRGPITRCHLSATRPPMRLTPISPTCTVSRSPATRSRSLRPAAHHTLFIGPPGSGQDHARGAPAGAAPASRSHTGARSNDGAFGGGSGASARRTHPASPVPGAPPHHLGDRARRWRLAHAATGRDLHVALRGALPRRARGVLALGARRVAPAVGAADRHGRSSEPARGPPGRLPARRGDEPVPVRWWTAGQLRVRRCGAAPLCPPGVGPVARPLRPARQRASPGRRRPVGQRAGRAVERRRRASRSGA